MTLRIAVVDKGTEVRKQTLHSLGQSAEFTVVAQGSTVAEAVAIVQSLNPHILLLGLGLRNRGLRTLWEIIDSGLHTKVVVLGSSTVVGDVLTALRCGASGYILKDSAASLTETLLKIHQSGDYNSPELSARLLLDLAQKHKTTDPTADPLAPKADRPTELEREIVSLVRQGWL